MKDTIITAKQKKRELIYLLVCFIVSNLLNILSIILYEATYSEIITSLFYVIIFSFSLYIISLLVRILFSFFCFILLKKKKDR